MITEFFNCVFHSFWTWAGTVVLVATVFGGLSRLGDHLQLLWRTR